MILLNRYRYVLLLLGTFTIFAMISLLVPTRISAEGEPSTLFPDPSLATNYANYPSPVSGNIMYLSVGYGEHISGRTVNDVYAYSSGTVTIEIIRATTCYSSQPGGSGTIDIPGGTSYFFDTQYFIEDSSGNRVSSILTVGYDCSSQNRSISFSASANRTYRFVANVAYSNASGENLYRLRVTGGNARLGFGPASTGGLSIANRDLPSGYESSYTTYFATSCNSVTLGNRSVTFSDADRGRYQGTGSYPELTVNLQWRIRGSTNAWNNVGTITLTGGDKGIDYPPPGLNFPANREYRMRIDNLSRPNALEILLDGSFNQLGVGRPCNPPITCNSISFSSGITPGSTFTVSVSINNSTGIPYTPSSQTTGDGTLEAGVTVNGTTNWNTSGRPVPAPDRTRQWRELGAGTNSSINDFDGTEAGYSSFNYERVRVNSSTFTFTAQARNTSGGNLAAGNHNFTLRFLTRSGAPGGPWLPHSSTCNTSVTVVNPDVCDNIANVQTSPPANHYTIGNNCYPDPTCSAVASFSVWAGQRFRSGVTVSNPASVSLDVTTIDVMITGPTGPTSSEVYSRTAYTNASNVAARSGTTNGSRTYLSYGAANFNAIYVTIDAPGEYTVTWSVDSEHAGNIYTTADGDTDCSTTVNVLSLPVACVNNTLNFSVGDRERAYISLNNNPTTSPATYTADVEGDDWTYDSSTGDIRRQNTSASPPTYPVLTASSPLTLNNGLSAGTIYSDVLDYSDVGQQTVDWSVDVEYVFAQNLQTAYQLRQTEVNSTIDCETTLQVSRRPYVRFYGNDVIAGANFIDEGAQCTATGLLDVSITSVSGISSSGRYQGSSAELAAIATGDISNFLPGTGSYRNDGGLLPDTPLSSEKSFNSGYDFLAFAGGGGSLGDVGGDFDEASLCNSLQPKGTTDWTTIPDPDVFPGAGNWRHTGDLTINGASIAEGEQVSIYVEGNVTISDNVTYSDISWSNKEDIPLMRVYATEDISIDGAVGTITGLYVAGGTIHTCTEFEEADTQADVNRVIGACGNIGGSNRLTVYGALAANNIVFGRTSGDVSLSNDDDNDPELGFSGGNKAERIHFTPELYIALWALDPSGGGSPPSTLDKSFDYIASPPPVF